MTSTKPSVPWPFDGRRGASTMNTWFYRLYAYRTPVVYGSPQLLLDENVKTTFASSLLQCNEANWWYMLVQSYQALVVWGAFLNAIAQEILPQDSATLSGNEYARGSRSQVSFHIWIKLRIFSMQFHISVRIRSRKSFRRSETDDLFGGFGN